MAKKLDLNKLRDEIEKEKQNKYTVSSHLGESVGAGLTPKDEFLHGLLTSYKLEQPTASTNLIKVVSNKVAEKKGETKKKVVNETANAPTPTHHTLPPPVDMDSGDREEKMYRDFDKMKKSTLAESIESFQGNQPKTPQSSMVNFGGQQFLTSLPTNYTAANPATGGAPMQLNEAVLVENVKNVVNGYLSENLGPIFEEAIKGTIIEMYAVERIKEVLNENRDLIKTVVVETIREIQAKNKAKAQS